MTREQWNSDHWRRALRGFGLSNAVALLEDAWQPAALAGSFVNLAKPGLNGRQRWRWELPTTADRPAGAVLFLKRYLRPPIRQQLDRLQRADRRHSRAWWEYEVAVRLLAAQIRVPRPVAVVEQMTAGVERRSALLMESVAGEAFDRAWAARSKRADIWTQAPLRHDLTVRLARFIAAFHSTGHCHRDLYLCHVFVDFPDTIESPPSFALIDLGRVHQPRLRRLRWIIKDLAQLDYSACQLGLQRSDRLRFLLAYLGLERGARRTAWYVRRVMRKSAAIAARDARKAQRA